MTGFGGLIHRLFGGQKESDADRSVVPARTRPETPTSFADAHNEFALAMYRQLRERRGNLLLSPFSVRTVLGMAHVGARGETAAQMEKRSAPRPQAKSHTSL
jgi:serine protease inhibitor